MYKLPMKDTYTMRKVRANIEELLMIIVKGAFEQGKSVKTTFTTLDNIIDFCELIDVYEEHELRTIFVNMLEEDINERKKENH